MTEGRGSNAGTCLINLKPWSERKQAGRTGVGGRQTGCEGGPRAVLSFAGHFGGYRFPGVRSLLLDQNPESLLFSLAGDLAAPLINRNAVKASYYGASAKQIQAVYDYERTLLNAYIEVANQVSNISNLKKSYDLKAQEVQALTESITISNSLFKSARADYMEVLMTQRDALESRFELVETKKQQMNAMVNIYQALGGGWD